MSALGRLPFSTSLGHYPILLGVRGQRPSSAVVSNISLSRMRGAAIRRSLKCLLLVICISEKFGVWVTGFQDSVIRDGTGADPCYAMDKQKTLVCRTLEGKLGVAKAIALAETNVENRMLAVFPFSSETMGSVFLSLWLSGPCLTSTVFIECVEGRLFFSAQCTIS